MVNYYLDTSALLKRYVHEVGSSWIRSRMTTAASLISSQLLIVEAISAFNRRAREGVLSQAEYRRLRDIFREDCRTAYQIVPLVDPIVDLACVLLEHYPLRAYDAVHLATAVTVQWSLQRRRLSPLIFLSADDRLNRAAQAEGLAVDNPNDHS